ncbi:MAG TPA: hypothetical protein P5059_02275, partial [Candidatus Dojkabacteria bacterium]|nr:hypothetical protein [Candidatus Dojkabacteria bacterium]
MEQFETTEKKEKTEGLSKLNKSELILATALFLVSLNPKNVNAPKIYHEPTPLIEPLKPDRPFRSEEEREFDFSVLNISNWEGYKMKLENVELMEKGYSVKTVADKTDLYSIPLLQSSFIHKKYNDDRPVKKVSVPHSMSYEIIEKRTLLGENEEEVTLGLIANDYKSRQGFVIVMSARDKFGIEEVFVEKEDHVEKEALDISISSTYSLVS